MKICCLSTHFIHWFAKSGLNAVADSSKKTVLELVPWHIFGAMVSGTLSADSSWHMTSKWLQWLHALEGHILKSRVLHNGLPAPATHPQPPCRSLACAFPPLYDNKCKGSGSFGGGGYSNFSWCTEKHFLSAKSFEFVNILTLSVNFFKCTNVTTLFSAGVVTLVVEELLVTTKNGQNM